MASTYRHKWFYAPSEEALMQRTNGIKKSRAHSKHFRRMRKSKRALRGHVSHSADLKTLNLDKHMERLEKSYERSDGVSA